MPATARHLVSFQRDVGTTADARGHVTPDWQTQFTAYVSIEPLTTGERIANQQVHPLATHKIRTRWIESHTPKVTWRIRYGDRIFHIDGMANTNEANREWVFTVTEEQAT